MKRIVSLLAMFLFLGTISLAQWVQTTLPGFNGTSHALLVSGTNLFAGTDSGGVFLSTNNGTSWTAVNTGIGLTDRYVWAMIATSYNVLVGTSGATYVSTNNGANWTSTSGSGGVSAFAMSVSNLVSTNVFAGTGGGVFLSTNNGVVWKLVKTGLTTTDVRALALSDTNIFAGTLGGGVFLSTNNGSKWTAVGTSQMDGSVRALLVSGGNLVLAMVSMFRLTKDRTGLQSVPDLRPLVMWMHSRPIPQISMLEHGLEKYSCLRTTE
jgi:hypothetical protein